MKKGSEYLVTAAIFFMLLMLSVGLVKLPEVYFAYSDRQLNGGYSTDSYHINNEIKAMTMAQKLSAFEREDCLMVEEGLVEPDGELYEKLVENSLKTYLSMILYEDSVNALLEGIQTLWKDGVYRELAYNIILVEENEIYSMKICALEMLLFQTAKTPYGHLLVMFDLETYKIFCVSLDGSVFFNSIDKVWQDKVSMSELNRYYETDIPWKDGRLWFSNYAVSIMPWSGETQEKKLLRSVTETLESKSYLADLAQKEYQIEK